MNSSFSSYDDNAKLMEPIAYNYSKVENNYTINDNCELYTFHMNDETAFDRVQAKFEPGRASSSRHESNELDDIIVLSDDEDYTSSSRIKDNSEEGSDAYTYRNRKQIYGKFDPTAVPSDIEGGEFIEPEDDSVERCTRKSTGIRKNVCKWDVNEVTYLVYFVEKYGRAWTVNKY